MPQPRSVLVSAIIMLGAGCLGPINIADDAQLLCVSNDDCPGDLVCNDDLGRCLPPGVEVDVRAPILIEVRSDVDVIGPAETALVTVVGNEPLATVFGTVTGAEGAVFDLDVDFEVGSDDAVFTISGDGLASGLITINVGWSDNSGNTIILGANSGVVVDADAPFVVNDSVVVRAVGAQNLLSPAAPAAARADSSVEVSATFSEPVTEAVMQFSATGGGAGGTTIIGASVTIDDAGTGVSAELPAASLAEINDGEYFITFDVVDRHGNQARVVLADKLRIDHTPPPTPTLSLLSRAPFGEGQRPSPLTVATGVADDAVLVIAVPPNIDVSNDQAPPLVGRAQPDAEGAFRFEVPLDVEGMVVVAVDGAGNVSAPARAERVSLVAGLASPTSPHRVQQRQASRDVLFQGGDVDVTNLVRAGNASIDAAPFWVPLTTRRQDRLPDDPLLANDPVSGGVIAVANGLTFVVDGAQFRQLQNVPQLPIRRGSGITTDTRRGRIVLFGGDDVVGSARNDLFEWDGRRWIEIFGNDASASDRPSPRVGAGVEYVDGEGVFVVNGCANAADVGIFGCIQGLEPEVWVYDGVGFEPRCAGAACGGGPSRNRPELGHDESGALIATGGFNDDGRPAAVPFPLPPALFRFEGDRWVGRCDGDCANALPAEASAFSDPTQPGFSVIGTCAGVTCVVRIDDDDSVDVVTLEGVGPAQFPLRGFSFQERSVIATTTGRLLMGQRAVAPDDLGSLIAVDAGRIGTVTPSALSPRCGGAVVALDDGFGVVGGCGNCGTNVASVGPGACTAPTNSLELPGLPTPAIGARSPIGISRGVARSDGGTWVMGLGLDPGSGATVIRLSDSVDLAAPPVTAILGVERSAEAAFSLDGETVAVLDGDYPSFEAGPVRDAVRSLDANGVLSDVCGADCGVVGASLGMAAAGGAGFGAVVFGGDTGDGGTSSITVRINPQGQGTTLAGPAPPPRRYGSMTFDAERQAVWLFGGTSLPTSRTGNDIFDCGVPGGLADCGDLWRFDDDNGWQRIDVADVLDVGRPQQRFFAQLGAHDGRLLLSGGRGPDFTSIIFATTTLTDAWQLEASSRIAPSHLVEVALGPYGADAGGSVGAVTVDWCGDAEDASGNDVAAEARVWVGSAFRSAPFGDDGAGCFSADIDVSDAADLVVRDGSLFVEVRPTGLTAGLGQARLSTRALTTTVHLAP